MSTGLLTRGSAIVLLYFANYKPLYVSSLLATYFEKNTHYEVPRLRVFDCVEGLDAYTGRERFTNNKSPAPLIQEDSVQKQLHILIVIEYELQQKAEKGEILLSAWVTFSFSLGS